MPKHQASLACRGKKAFLLLLSPDKSLTSGGTQPADFILQKKQQGQQINHLLA
jgi:hypothetical protein